MKTLRRKKQNPKLISLTQPPSISGQFFKVPFTRVVVRTGFKIPKRYRNYAPQFSKVPGPERERFLRWWRSLCVKVFGQALKPKRLTYQRVPIPYAW